MRQRLTASFVVVSVLLLLGALWVRGYTTGNAARDNASRDLRQQARTTALLIDQRQALDRPVDQAWLAGVVDPHDEITWAPSEGPSVVARGPDYDGGSDALTAELGVSGGTVTVKEPARVAAAVADTGWSALLWSALLIGLTAALVGYVLARLLSAPFRQLVVAAEQLGRGRFDLYLPRTRIPEARALSQALLTSAGQLQERLANEQAFAEHASHVLRTPLTGLRLELEDLAGRDDVPPDVRATATRSVGRIEGMDAIAGELVALSRRGALVSGAQVALRDLATQCAQTWADALAEHDRELTAAVEGDLQATYTPGPVEHVLDLLLADTLQRGEGPVRMVFESGDDGLLRIALTSADDTHRGRGATADLPLTQARAVVSALGGRLTGDGPRELAILLPRR